MIRCAGHLDIRSIALEPRRLWSLWDMTVNFRLNAVRLIHSGLGSLISMSNNNQRIIEQAGGYDNPDVINSPQNNEALRQSIIDVASIADLSKNTFADLRCVHIDHAIVAMTWWLKHDPKKWSDIKAKAITLRDTIDNELKEYLYYQYPKQKGAKLLSWESDWAAAIVKFPIIKVDVFSATDCYALEHNTASVFHCMRVLERGLAVLANDVGIDFDIQQWNTIIEQIETEITKLRKTLPRGTDKNTRMQFLSEAAKEFFYFKDGWRNYVSHNRGRYDEHQAAGVLEHTRAFMNHLAGHLSE
jgi:hypothetical protein